MTGLPRAQAVWMIPFATLLATCGPIGTEATSATGDSQPAESNVQTIATGADRPEQMLRITIRLSKNGAEILNRTTDPNTVNRRDPHKNSQTFFRALDEGGAVLLQRGFKLHDILRSEIADDGGGLIGKHLDVEEPVVSLAVPLYPNTTTIQLYSRASAGAGHAHELLGEVHL